MYRILIVDDESSVLSGIELNLSDNPEYEILTASDKDAALEILESREIDLVVSDLMMPGIEDGLQLMERAKKQWYEPSVIAMTAFETIDNVISAMQAGADDFLSKGFGIDELSLRIKNMLKRKNEKTLMAYENRVLKETIQKQYNDFNIIGKSKQMHEMLNRVQRIAADANVTCLIQGESGTGKDLFARTIHALSKRNNAPFVPVNCAAIPENLIESELFGHEKGSFTGAISTKPGKFEQAKGGIIFLDEIGELPLPLQVRLLRVLEERVVYRIGGKRAIDIDVMVISATNKNIQKMVEKRLFREELFFRLNVTNINILPLREHREDIRPLAKFFLMKFNSQRRQQLEFAEKTLEMLQKYDFPGNVRELRNIIEDASLFCENPLIQPEDINLKQTALPKRDTDVFIASPEKASRYSNLSYEKAVLQFEKEYFMELLNEFMWNINEAAKKAGLTREWFSKKISRLDLKKV